MTRRIRPAMGTFVGVCVRDGSMSGVDAAFAEIDRLEHVFSEFRVTSAVSQINRAAGIEPVNVPLEVARLLRIAVEVAEQTGGAFDPTFRPLADGWDFESSRVPSRQELAELRKLVGYRDLVVGRTTAFLRRPGMKIALGGIAKAFIADRAADAAVAAGAREVLIDAGGDLVARGKWQVAIRDPRTPGRAVARLELQDGATATSGDSEKFFDRGGIRYHHLLDPRTGRPALRCRLATVAAPDAARADALATALFVLGPEHGREVVPEGMCALWVDANGNRITRQRCAKCGSARSAMRG